MVRRYNSILIAFLLLLLMIYGSSLLGQFFVNTTLLKWGDLTLASCPCSTPEEWPADRWSLVLPYLKIAKRWTDTSAIYRMLGYHHMSLGNESQALVAWRKADLTSKDLVNWGQLAEEQGQRGSAIRWYVRAASLSPEDSTPWYQAAQTYEAQGAWERAIEAYQQVVSRNSWDALPVREGDIYVRMALIYFSRLDIPQLKKTLESSEAALQTDDFSSSWSEAHAHYLRGRVLWQNHYQTEAHLAFQRAVRTYKDHVEAHYWLGVTYYVVAHDVIAAEIEMKEAIALQPENKWPYIYLGKIYTDTDRLNQAIEAYEQALTIDPNDAKVFERLQELKDTQ